MTKVTIDPNDMQDIANMFNSLNKKVDDKRLKFSNTLLTIYTAVTSGLVVLATSIGFDSVVEQVSFLIIVTTSVLIIFSSIVERFGYFLTSKTGADTYFEHVRKTGKHLNKPFGGSKWQSNLIKVQIFIILASFFINICAVLVFVYTRILA